MRVPNVYMSLEQHCPIEIIGVTCIISNFLIAVNQNCKAMASMVLGFKGLEKGLLCKLIDKTRNNFGNYGESQGKLRCSSQFSSAFIY